MAISSYKVFLMQGTENGGNVTYSKLIDIKDFPDLIQPPESLETTTLSDGMRTYIPGIQDTEQLQFTCNYTSTDFSTVSALQGTEQYLAVWFGGTENNNVVTPDGSAGKFSFKGYVDAGVNGAGVNEVIDMTVTVTPSTVITFAAS